MWKLKVLIWSECGCIQVKGYDIKWPIYKASHGHIIEAFIDLSFGLK